jgi:TolB-like protein/tRNA A-37 threonylcarbamoyl transferase component Bud32
VPGETLQHYSNLEKLGEGGMGVVFKARDTRLNRNVVIKALHPDKARDADPRRRFFQEAQAASALNHPNIVTVYDIGSENGVDFIVMEYVNGSPMDVLLQEGPLKPEVVIHYGAQIADALSAAHAAGIVHRDLKPGNIVISSSGFVKLLDFGLAKVTDTSPVPAGFERASPVTADGCIVGTAAYMAPEQALGKPVDSRTDLFSLGAVLYEMLTGRRAFEGDSAISTLTAVLRDDPADICILNREVPQALADVVYRCLRKQTSERYSTAADLKADLETALHKPVLRATEEPSIAVVPFQNFTTESNDFFAEGLMQELAAAFAAAPGLRIVSKSARNATAVLEGSIRKSGARVRVVAQLVDPAAARHVWTERYDRDTADVFKTQEELATLIVAAVRRKLSAASPVFVEGLAQLKRFTPDSLSIARDCFERAIRDDRDNPSIYVAMADYYAAAAVLAVREPKQLLPKAEWAANRALEMDSLEAGAHASLAVVQAIYHFRWDLAAAHLHRALENFQPYLFVLAPGLHDAPTGTDASALVYRAITQYLCGDSFGAYRLAQSAAKAEPGYWPATFVQALADGTTEPPSGLLWSQGVFARRGPDQAQRVIETLIPQRQSRYVPSSLFATAFLTLGQLEKAIAALERAAAERDPFLPAILMDPALEPLRSEPALAALLQRSGLTTGWHTAGAR